MSTYRLSPSGVRIAWQSPVATAAALPLAGNSPGDARVAVDTGTVWVWTGVAWASPSSTDEQVKVSAADTTPGFLSPKTSAGTNVVLAILNPGLNEQLEISVPSAAPSGPAGGDLSGSYPSPAVSALTETSGPTSLPFGAIPPGSVLARLGGLVVGVPPVFPPIAHAPTHAPVTGTDPLATAAAVGVGGGNAIGAADALSRSDHGHAIRETGGPTDLTVGAIAAGQFLRRVAGAIIGATPAALMFWGNNSVAATTATRYLEPGYEGATAPLVAAIVQIPVPVITGTIRRMFVRHNGTAGNGNAIVYTLRVSGVATALSVSLASTAVSGSNVVAAIAVVATDILDIEVTKALAVGTSPARIMVVVEVDSP